ncbi:hypothetical protein [Romboutsia sp.]|uniref:hypothetical protein n=1 Tax=Romboutsia sp. TaxID=1965302 RepID=UPI003F3CA826
MSCNNIVTFENLIPIPNGLEYVVPSGETTFYVAVNTDDLKPAPHLGKYNIEDVNNICPNKSVNGFVDLYEIRVSGYLTYSISVKCLASSINFTTNVSSTQKKGCISQSSILPMSSPGLDSTTLPYVVTKYSADNSTDINVKVSLLDISIDSPIVIDGNSVVILRGSFKISTD